MHENEEARVSESNPDESRQRLKRRGLMAGAAALIAATIARNTAQPVEAAGNPMLLDTNNQATTFTGLVNPYSVGFQCESTYSPGGTSFVSLYRQANGIAIKGLAYPSTVGNGDAVGVQGGIGDGNTFPASAATLAVQGVNFATGAGGTGVQGLVQSNPTTRVGASQGMGVEGLNYSIGPNANGSASGSIGVEGTIGVNADSSTAVNGLNLSTAPTTYGVAGTSYGSNGAGLFGINYSSGVGAQGSSVKGHGLVGTTQATDGHAGLFGGGFAAGSIGVRGSAFVAGTTAGVFDGDVIITGTLRIGGAKSAFVPHPDGSHRMLYCVESPDSWFEDFGKGKLTNGKADVTLDPDFAAVVHTDDYHIFLTTYGEEGNGLTVAETRPNGFTVKERHKGTSTLTFSYRVVAKRKDIIAERLAKVAPPPAIEQPKTPEPLIPEKYQEHHRKNLVVATSH